MDSSDPETGAEQNPDPDPRRVEALRRRLNEALLEVENGEYFRSRIHGWLAYRDDADVQMPETLASRLTVPFDFTRPENAADVSTLDAFVLAYHAAESLCRQMLALIDGSGPDGLPLIELSLLKAGQAFNDRLSMLRELPDAELTKALDYLFLPTELQEQWRDEPEGRIARIQQYLRLWFRALARYASEWRNPYNSAKHGLAVGARPTQFSFYTDGEAPAAPVLLMDGPTLRTVEHEDLRDNDGRLVKGPDGKRVVRWLWVYRAVDPEELIAQVIVTADLLDWLRAIATWRLLGRDVRVVGRTEPLPLDLSRPTSPGRRFRIPLGAVPLQPEEADALLAVTDDDE